MWSNSRLLYGLKSGAVATYVLERRLFKGKSQKAIKRDRLEMKWVRISWSNFVALDHCFLPLRGKRDDATHGYLKNLTTVKGCPSLIRCHSLLRPWWMGTEGHNFGLLAFLHRKLSTNDLALKTA